MKKNILITLLFAAGMGSSVYAQIKPQVAGPCGEMGTPGITTTSVTYTGTTASISVTYVGPQSNEGVNLLMNESIACTGKSGVLPQSCTVSGLTRGNSYNFRADAFRHCIDPETGLSTSEHTSSQTVSVPLKPLAPTGLTIIQSSIAANSIKIQFNGSSGATRYRVDVATDGLFTNRLQSDVIFTTTSPTITGLPSNTTCFIQVRAENGGGQSENSISQNALTKCGAPLNVTFNPGQITQTSFLVTWTAPVGGAPLYFLRVATSPDFSTGVIFNGGVQGLGQQITGLTQNTTYFVRVNALNNQGLSDNADASVTTMKIPPSFVNYIRKRHLLVEGITATAQLDDLAPWQVNINTSYLDGFARPLEDVQKNASPQGRDMVLIHQYDFMGREVKKYLPYTSSELAGLFVPVPTAQSLMTDFYHLDNDKIANTSAPYAETLVEASPLNRVLKQGAPGEDWQLNTTHVKTMAYANNTSADKVWIWAASGTSLAATAFYAPGTLSVTQVTDENGHISREYKDKYNQTVLTEQIIEDGARLRTYFVFNDLNRLAFVIPPKTIAALSTTATSVTIAADVLAKECYTYTYDGRGRQTIKTIPGAGPAYTVYDPWNRPVLTQHANQRVKSKWSFTKYDDINRPILTGEITLAGDLTATQQAVNTFYANVAGSPTLRYEEAGSAIHGYTNRSYPVLANQNVVYTASYYDNYNFLSQLGTAYQFVPESTLGLSAANTSTNGLLTGGKTLILGTTTYLNTVNYYDAKHRPVQILADCHLGGIDRVSSQLDFTGRVLKTRHVRNSTQPITIDEEFIYDPMFRQLKAYHTVNLGTRVQLFDYRYNEIGQRVEENIHSTNGTTFLQSMDYTYNVRGWMEQMNPVETETNVTYPDQYGFALSYNTPIGVSTGFQPSFNGNIAAFTERRPGTTDTNGTWQSAYNYRYDSRDQLTQANYLQPSDPTKNGVYDLPVITYDANGNITTLQRKGITTSGTPGTIDNLIYNYNGNQLIKVDDSADAAKGFINR